MEIILHCFRILKKKNGGGGAMLLIISSDLLLILPSRCPRPLIQFYTLYYLFNYFLPCFGLCHNIIPLHLQHNEL